MFSRDEIGTKDHVCVHVAALKVAPEQDFRQILLSVGSRIRCCPAHVCEILSCKCKPPDVNIGCRNASFSTVNEQLACRTSMQIYASDYMPCDEL